MLRISYEKGGEGHAESFDNGRLILVSPRAYAPGAPIAFTAHVGDSALALKAKSLGSKRRDDGLFVVTSRPISWRREERIAIEEHT